MTVTFFGHRTTPPEIADILRKELISLIETQGADTFPPHRNPLSKNFSRIQKKYCIPGCFRVQ